MASAATVGWTELALPAPIQPQVPKPPRRSGGEANRFLAQQRSTHGCTVDMIQEGRGTNALITWTGATLELAHSAGPSAAVTQSTLIQELGVDSTLQRHPERGTSVANVQRRRNSNRGLAGPGRETTQV